ncbi:hypothetical protein U1Q18_020033 [Sarracenia purpurea var. burkii]
MGVGQGLDLQRKKKRDSVGAEVQWFQRSPEFEKASSVGFGGRRRTVMPRRSPVEFACESPPPAAAGSDGDGKRYCGRESACEFDDSCESGCESYKSPSGISAKRYFDCEERTKKGFF